jgi:PAS domain-containing protein
MIGSGCDPKRLRPDADVHGVREPRMMDPGKSRSELLEEIAALRRRVEELERARDEARGESHDGQRRIREQLEKLERTQEELRVIKEHLTDAQRVAGVGSWEWNLLEDRAWWSDELYRIFDRDKERTPLSFEAFLELVHPDDQTALRKHFDAVFSKSEPSSVEFRFVLDTGAVRIIRTSSKLERTQEGMPARLVGTVQDVTERRRVEAVLARDRDER